MQLAAVVTYCYVCHAFYSANLAYVLYVFRKDVQTQSFQLIVLSPPDIPPWSQAVIQFHKDIQLSRYK